MQARGFLNYLSKYYYPKVIDCIWQPNELEREINKNLEWASRVPGKNLRVMAHPAPPP